MSYTEGYILSIIEAKNVGLAVANTRLFNAEYRQEMFLYVRHVLINLVLIAVGGKGLTSSKYDQWNAQPEMFYPKDENGNIPADSILYQLDFIWQLATEARYCEEGTKSQNPSGMTDHSEGCKSLENGRTESPHFRGIYIPRYDLSSLRDSKMNHFHKTNTC